jgi:hypothetical protein
MLGFRCEVHRGKTFPALAQIAYICIHPWVASQKNLIFVTGRSRRDKRPYSGEETKRRKIPC